MPLEILQAKLEPNIPHTFSFSARVSQRMAGINSFKLCFGGDNDHYIKTASISLTIDSNGNEVTVTPNAILVNNDDAALDKDSSYITVVVVVWTGAGGEGLKLANVRDIPDGKQSEAISLPDNNPNILKAVLSGFKYTFEPNHCVKTVYARTGTTSDGTLAYITGEGKMYNDSNDFADTTIDGALLANCDPSLNVEIQNITKLNDYSEVTFSSAVSNFAAFLTGYQLQFEGKHDHEVKCFGAEIRIYDINGSKVSIAGFADMKNKGDDYEDDNESYVSGFIIGY